MQSWLKDRPKLNLVIDTLMFILLMCIAGLGFLIKFVLIPGFKRNLIYGSDVELYFLGLDRHQWGSIHLWLNFLFLFLLLLHIILHWKTIVCIFRKIVTGKSMRRGIAIGIAAIGFIFAVAPLFIRPDVVPLPREHVSKHKHISYSDMTGDKDSHDGINRMDDVGLNNQALISHTNNKGDRVADNRKNRNDILPGNRPLNEQTVNAVDTAVYHRGNKTGVLLSDQVTDENQGERLHRNAQDDIEVYGYMTLKEVALRYHVSVQELADALNIPVEKSGHTLGRLRKDYDFYMSDVRDIILKLSE